jgi:hypothetical protein
LFNAQLERSKTEIQQIQVAQSMLSTLFSEDEFKALATKRLMDEVLVDEALKQEIGRIAEDYLNSKFDRSLADGDVDAAQQIFSAAKSIGGTVGTSITQRIEADTEKTDTLSKYQRARTAEIDGYKAMARGDFERAYNSFESAYRAYPDLHSVSEVYGLLRKEKNQLDDQAAQQRVLDKVVEDYTWKVPEDIVRSLERKDATRR